MLSKDFFDKWFLGKIKPILVEKNSDFYTPKSIAVIGASTNLQKLGSIVLKNIIDSGFDGQLFPVNPKAEPILNLPTYTKYSEIPNVPDLAIIAIPASGVLEVLKEIQEKGTKNVVVLSAGFKEVGQEGLELENKLTNFAKENNMQLLGPNCLGFVNNDIGLNATFGKVTKLKKSAWSNSLRYISQSGAIASSIFDWSSNSGIGFSEFVTLGNKAVITENEVLEHFLNANSAGDIQKPVGIYIESVSDGKKLVELISKISKNDPVFVLKPGKSESAKKAMQSHTGSLAGEDIVLEAALKKSGAIRCDGIEDFFDLSMAFALEKSPKGEGVAIISNAGGPAVLTSDFVELAGLKLVSFDEKTTKQLKDNLPTATSILNPVDILGDALSDRYKLALELVLKDENVHSVLVILTPQIMTEIEKTAEIIGELSKRYQKTILCSFIGGHLVSKGSKILLEYGVPAFSYPERAVQTLAKMRAWEKYRDTKFSDSENNNSSSQMQTISKMITEAKYHKQTMLNSEQVNQFLEALNFKFPLTKEFAKTEIDEALEFVKEVNFPVVFKIVGDQILHKTELGGVKTNIQNEDEFSREFNNFVEIIMNKNLDGKIQVQQQVSTGVELILGYKKDLQFGEVVLFGAGGVTANLLDDKNVILPTEAKPKISAILAGAKIAPLLKGYRGKYPDKFDDVVDFIYHFQKEIVKLPIEEIDFNPVIVNNDGIFVVDAKVLI